MKTKYEIVKNNIEIGFKERKSIKQGITVSQDNYEEEIKGSYEKAEDALLELQNYKTEIRKTGNAYNVTEYYVQENKYDEEGELMEYDEEGNFIENGNILEFSKMEISVIEKPSYSVVGTFDNFEDAMKKNDEIEESFLEF